VTADLAFAQIAGKEESMPCPPLPRKTWLVPALMD
jgi:hypothetical protein